MASRLAGKLSKVESSEEGPREPEDGTAGTGAHYLRVPPSTDATAHQSAERIYEEICFAVENPLGEFAQVQ
jgi:hypothetical protein